MANNNCKAVIDQPVRLLNLCRAMYTGRNEMW